MVCYMYNLMRLYEYITKNRNESEKEMKMNLLTIDTGCWLLFLVWLLLQ